MILAAGVYLGYDSISNAGKYFALVFGGIGYMGQAANLCVTASSTALTAQHLGQRGRSFRL